MLYEVITRLYLQRAYKNSENLLSLINSLLDIAKLKARKQTFAMGQYELVELAREAFENCSSLNKNDGVRYVFNTNVSAVWIECDPLKLKQIITNLISVITSYSIHYTKLYENGAGIV